MDDIVSMPLENYSKPETIQLVSTEVEKSYNNGHGSFPTRNFPTKENERHSLCPRSTHDAAPVWSDKGLISYDLLLQLRRYRTPINSPAINSLHRTLPPSVAFWHPSGPPSPACKSWWASEDSSVCWNGDDLLAVLLGRSVGGVNPLEQSSSAAHFKFPLWYYIWHLIWNPKLL